MAADERVAEHFQDLDQQAHAARFGMWVFLASEVLLFAGLFGLYAAYRARYPHGFSEGVHHNASVWGFINTGILLTSSFLVAWSVHALQHDKKGRTLLLLAGAILLGTLFLGIKFHEYSKHFHEGIHPGGAGRYFDTHEMPGLVPFYTLYFFTTGLHALHVIIGLGVLTWMVLMVLFQKATARYHHPLQVGAMYWHLVDVVWIFVWPMFYLMKE